MNLLELLMPLFIILLPAIFKTFVDKDKANKNSQKKSTQNNSTHTLRNLIEKNIENARTVIENSVDKNKKSINVDRSYELDNEEIEVLEKKEKKLNRVDRINKSKEISKDMIKDEISKREIGSNDFELDFKKEDVLKGIIYSEILSPPKALKNRKN